MLRILVAVIAFLLLLPIASAKSCIYNYDRFKYILVWDYSVKDFDTCNYWNWHARNLAYFGARGQPYIVSVCYRDTTQEMGFMLGSPLNEAPDHFFMPDGGECEYTRDNVYDVLNRDGWTCMSTWRLEEYCRQQGNPAIGLYPQETFTMTPRPSPPATRY
ncbi:hypothetical protein HDU96_004029 [Phlyctochytrium bullatum]|nr:hypothetical protein HDU96_004029 [Phlyctochytrium bullatum]